MNNYDKILEDLEKKINKETSKIIRLKQCILELVDIATNFDIIYNFQKDFY